MMLEYIGWKEAAVLIIQALEDAFINKNVTLDFAKILDVAHQSTSQFSEVLIDSI